MVKKTNKDALIKNPKASASRARAPSPISSDLSTVPPSHDSFDNMHNDEVAGIGQQLENGEVLQDSDVEVNPVPMEVQELILELQSSQKVLKSKISELSAQVEKDESGHVWKKEGLKKQNDIAQRVLQKCQQALMALHLNDHGRTKAILESGIAILNERIKELRIADSSDAGWETVNVYRSHPLASDSDDDKRIRKAEKLAKEKLAAKSRRGRPNRRGNYRRPFFRYDRPDNYHGRQEYPYRSFGSARTQDNAQRNTYVPDRRRQGGTLCFFCGQSGHWQSNCPNKAERRDR